MSLEVRVEPEAVKRLVEKAREVPNERIDAAIEKLHNLESVLSSWEGEGKPAYDSAHANVIDTLNSTKNLMTAMLLALDRAIDDFSEMDEDISKHFEQAVDSYTAD